MGGSDVDVHLTLNQRMDEEIGNYMWNPWMQLYSTLSISRKEEGLCRYIYI